MAIDLQGMVGPQRQGDGNAAKVRLDNSGALVVRPLGGALGELTLRQRVFHACTPAAGVAPGTALGATAAHALYNPAASRRNLFVFETRVSYVSGTLGAGSLVYALINNPNGAAPTGGTPLTAYNGYIGGDPGQGAAYAGSTVSATPVLFRALCGLGASLASTAVAPWFIVDRPDDGIIVPPGQTLCVEGIAAAGSSPLVLISQSWVELDI